MLFCALAVCSILSLKNNEFCEKDEKTGLCKHAQEDENEPCWYEDKEPVTKEDAKVEPEKMEFGKLYMIDGVKVCQSF